MRHAFTFALASSLGIACGGGGGGEGEAGSAEGTGTSTAGDSGPVSVDATTAFETSAGPPDTSAGPLDTSGDGTTSGPTCTDDTDCAGATPLCADGACVGCGEVDDADARCAALDPAAALCGSAGGCVQCRPDAAAACSDATPVCDAVDETCRGCAAHPECAVACEIETGECFTPADDGGCVLEVPDNFVTILGALASVDPGERCAILLADLGPDDYADAITIDQGKRIAFLPQSGSVEILSPSGPPVFLVEDGGHLYVDNIALTDGSNTVLVRGASVVAHFDHVEIARNESVAGITVSEGARVELRNVIVAGEPFMGIGADGLRVAAGSAARVLDSTLVGLGGSALAVAADSDVEVRNAILFTAGNEPSVSGVAGTFSHCAAEDVLDGDGNVQVALTNESFADFDGRDFRISGITADDLAEVGLWQSGDPIDDIDGDPRVAVDGLTEPPGADVP